MGAGLAINSTREDGEEGGGGFINISATAVDLMEGCLSVVVAVLVTGPLWCPEHLAGI